MIDHADYLQSFNLSEPEVEEHFDDIEREEYDKWLDDLYETQQKEKLEKGGSF